MSRKIVNTNIRFNLEKDDDRKAWEYLQTIDRTQYKSYSKAVILAVTEYFARKERLADDPYLETREKEDAFLGRVTETIEQGLRSAAPLGLLGGLLQSVQQSTAPPVSTEEQTEMEETALDFADSF